MTYSFNSELQEYQRRRDLRANGISVSNFLIVKTINIYIIHHIKDL